jgi:hypothetical protein
LPEGNAGADFIAHDRLLIMMIAMAEPRESVIAFGEQQIGESQEGYREEAWL